jgi:hypothetical protein
MTHGGWKTTAAACRRASLQPAWATTLAGHGGWLSKLINFEIDRIILQNKT